MSSLFDLSGKTAIITGGTRGIGKVIATGLLQHGAKVIVTSRKTEACENAQIELSEFGDCSAIPSDLSSQEGIEKFVEAVCKTERSINILFNNAGAAWGQPFDEYTTDGWDRVMDLNVKAIFFLTQKLAPLLRAQSKLEEGRIVNIGSIEGFSMPLEKGNFAYPVSKAAVHHLTRVLASEFAEDGITVNAIAPGPFESKMTAFMLDDPERREEIKAAIPMGRIGKPDDIVGLAVFLASSASAYITGVTIPLDGGYVNVR